jgi:hypothetical protein
VGIISRLLGSDGQRPATPEVEGVAALTVPDEDEVYRRAVEEWEQTKEHLAQRERQRLHFDSGPICLVWIADLHLGGKGIDYPRVFEEAEIIAETPGMWAGTVGDLVDQFILEQMRSERLEARLTIPDEWVLLKRYLKALGPRLKVAVRGNHDAWVHKLSGVDYFREVLTSVAPSVLYDEDDCRFRLEVGDAAWRVRVRHKWKGSSIYNPSHGIERAAKWDQDFDLGVGAHTHEGGFARGFSAGGRDCMAVMCGSYKVHDRYARSRGFPKPRRTTAVSVIFWDGRMVGVEYLPLAARIMRQFYDG